MNDEYIKKDALIDRMYHDAFEIDTDMQKWDSGCWIRYKMFENAIDDVPTIELKRGRWTDRTHDQLWAIVNFAYCSECKQPIMHKHERPLWNFCPNCGARMKGADDDRND